MRKINLPDITQDEVCSAFKNLKYRQRILAHSEHYEDYLKNLQTLFDDEQVVMLKDTEYVGYMKNLYSCKFSHKGSATYRFYLKIKEAQHICPYCNMTARFAKELDHYLPKSVFPSLSVSPVNLVPICSDCNNLKKDHYSVNRNEMIIHPYFDDFATRSFDFIKCTIIEKKPIGFIFSIEKLDDWNDCVFNRVVKHFQILKLEDLYRTDFESTFEAYVYELKDIYQNDNINGVKIAIERRMNSYRESKTFPWHYAGFKALLNSKWFFHRYFESSDEI